MTNWFEHPVALGSARSWLRLLSRAEGIDREFWPRVAAITLTTLATAPLRAVERARFRDAVSRITIHPEPLFVLGHWRTGTTHLLNLVAQDPQFGFVSTFQAMAPGFVLSTERMLKPRLARALAKSHPTREIDSMPLDLDAPQEEAFALANLTPYASLHGFTLPRQALPMFERYGMLETLSAAERREWLDTYVALLRTATLRCAGRRLVLKDPTNTARIGTLLELFPRAKFVHIVRDPYRVLPSTLGANRVVLPISQLQRVSVAQVEETVLAIFERMMRKYLAERALIPRENLSEVRFEDLEERPLEILAKLYDDLDLGGWAGAQPRIRNYLSTIRAFQKNEYVVDERVVARVNERWGFALEAWGYPRIEPAGPKETRAE